MGKKEYTIPGLVKVELNHEQAVLGVCSADVTDMRDSDTTDAFCGDSPVCKQDKNTGNSSSHS